MLILFILISVLSEHAAFAQADLPPVQIPYSHANIKVDGALEDWGNVFSTVFEDSFSILRSKAEIEKFSSYPGKESFDLTRIKKPLSRNRVKVTAYWNHQNLYFAFVVYDRHLFAEIAKASHDPDIYLNDGIEVYLDTRNDSKTKMDTNDYQFSVDVRNNFMVFRGDRKLVAVDSIGVPKDYGQNVLFVAKVKVFGTVNDSTEMDSAYVVEMAIPFVAIGLIPETGMKMKLDLCNNDIDYSFQGASTLTDTLRLYWPFNWQGLSDFGYPYNWREVQLIGQPSWLEALSSRMDKSWLLTFFIAVALSVAVIVTLFVRIRRLKRLPRFEELAPAKVVFLTAAPPEGQILSANEELLQKATDFILKDKSESLRSEDVSRNLAISLRNLQRITREELNCTPTNFVYLVKLNAAAAFLSNKQGNVTEAAYEFGFYDSSYFSKLFKKHFGVSPQEYKKANP